MLRITVKKLVQNVKTCVTFEEIGIDVLTCCQIDGKSQNDYFLSLKLSIFIKKNKKYQRFARLEYKKISEK